MNFYIIFSVYAIFLKYTNRFQNICFWYALSTSFILLLFIHYMRVCLLGERARSIMQPLCICIPWVFLFQAVEVFHKTVNTKYMLDQIVLPNIAVVDFGWSVSTIGHIDSTSSTMDLWYSSQFKLTEPKKKDRKEWIMYIYSVIQAFVYCLC